MEGMGEEKVYFFLLKSIKRPKGPLVQSVSANFVADCVSSPAVQTQKTKSQVKEMG